jgi:hypothetical protein
MRREVAYAFSLLCVLIPQSLYGVSANAGTESETLRPVQGGKTDYAIVQGRSPTESEVFAVTELRDYLEKSTGVRLPVVDESKMAPEARGIYVGWTEFSLKHGIDSTKLAGEEWLMQTIGNNLVLTGGRPVGSLYAVYEFLESRVGCRWLDRDTEIIPRCIDLTLPELKVRSKPAFWHRTIYTGLQEMNGSSEMVAKEGLFVMRNKSTSFPAKFGQVSYGSPGNCHTFYAYSKDFPADHPEYFSMDAQGKRERAASGSGPAQLCLTNPEVRRLLLARLRKFIAQDRADAAKSGRPAPRVYDISQNDQNDHICLCPACKAFAAKEGSQSGLVIACMNELADGIKDEYPDVLIMTFAYTSTLKTPKTLKPRDNVIIRLAQLNSEWMPDDPHYPDYFRPLSHPINRAAYDDIAAWSKLAKHLAIWDYWILYQNANKLDNFPTPYVNVACLQPDLQLCLTNRVDNVFVECESSDTTSFSTLKLWLGQKLLQDPNQPVEPLLTAFMQGYYSSAAPQMIEYLRYMEKRIAAAPATGRMSSMCEHLRPYLDLEFFTTAHRLLTNAEKACGEDANALLHVRYEWIPVDAAIFNMWLQLERQLPKGQTMPFDRDAILRQYADGRYAMLNQFYYGKIPAKIKEDVEKELNKYRDLPGIEKKKP